MENQAMVKPGCTAYFHIPPAWMGDAPSKQECETGSSSVFTKIVFERTIIHGIKITVRRDGVVVFDCRGWADAGETEIPAYVSEPRKPVPQAVSNAELVGEQRAQRRAQLINAHQACLCSSVAEVRRRGQGIGAFVLPSQAYQTYRPYEPIPKWDSDVVQSFVTKMTNFADLRLRRSPDFQHRLIYEIDVLARSFDLLEEIMRHPTKGLLDLTELMYRAGTQYSLNRFQESLILSWAACERLLNELWERYIDNQNSNSTGSKKRVDGKRKEKLTGRDFSASIISETLELAGLIPPELFEELNGARKARNDWMHKLKPVGERESIRTIWAALHLYTMVSGVKLQLNFTRYSGSGGACPKTLLLQDDQKRMAADKLKTRKALD